MPTDLRFPAPDGVMFQTRATLICVQEGRLLTCWDERFPDFFALPGGAVQTGESSAAAARREWHEETGLRADVTRCATLERFFHWEGRERHEFGFFFRVELTGKLPATVLDNPHVFFRWLDVDALDDHTLYPRCVSQLLRLPAGEIGHFVTDERA